MGLPASGRRSKKLSTLSRASGAFSRRESPTALGGNRDDPVDPVVAHQIARADEDRVATGSS